jgi:predicted nucleotidyltransferase
LAVEPEVPARVDLPAPLRRRIAAAIAEAVASLPEVRVAYVYGSFARGEPFADIDLAVMIDEPHSWRVPGRLADELGARLRSLPAPLDVVTLNAAPSSFRLRVAQEGKLVYEREPGEDLELWVRARSEVNDFDAWRRAHQRVP